MFSRSVPIVVGGINEGTSGPVAAVDVGIASAIAQHRGRQSRRSRFSRESGLWDSSGARALGCKRSALPCVRARVTRQKITEVFRVRLLSELWDSRFGLQDNVACQEFRSPCQKPANLDRFDELLQ